MLKKIDFKAAEFKPLDGGDYPGQTAGWEAKPTKAGDSTNIIAKFKVTYTNEEGEEKTRSIQTNYNLKPTALWRFKRDAIAMGADPADFAKPVIVDPVTGEETGGTDIEAICNELFGTVPTPVTLTLGINAFRREGEDTDSHNNEVVKVVAR